MTMNIKMNNKYLTLNNVVTYNITYFSTMNRHIRCGIHTFSINIPEKCINIEFKNKEDVINFEKEVLMFLNSDEKIKKITIDVESLPL